LGLGTCPIGFARDILQTGAMKKELNIPMDYTPVLPIIVGFPSGESPKAERKSPLILNWIK